MKAPAFQLYPADFLSSPKVQTMNTEEIGAYVLMLMYAWLSEPCAHLPNDDIFLARLCRVTVSRWKKVREKIIACWQVTDDGSKIFNARLLATKRSQDAFRAKNSAAGKISASTKAQHNLNGTSTEPQRNLNVTSTENQFPVEGFVNSSSSSSSASASPEDKKHPTDVSLSTSVDGAALTKLETEVVAGWNTLPPEHPRVARIGKRLQVLRQRLRDPWWRDNWKDAVQRLQALPNMRGKCGHNFVATFEWFIRPESVTKLVEGVCESWFKKEAPAWSEGELVEELR